MTRHDLFLCRMRILRLIFHGFSGSEDVNINFLQRVFWVLQPYFLWRCFGFHVKLLCKLWYVSRVHFDVCLLWLHELWLCSGKSTQNHHSCRCLYMVSFIFLKMMQEAWMLKGMRGLLTFINSREASVWDEIEVSCWWSRWLKLETWCSCRSVRRTETENFQNDGCWGGFGGFLRCSQFPIGFWSTGLFSSGSRIDSFFTLEFANFSSACWLTGHDLTISKYI